MAPTRGPHSSPAAGHLSLAGVAVTAALVLALGAMMVAMTCGGEEPGPMSGTVATEATPDLDAVG